MILAFKNIDAFSDSSIISFEDGCGYSDDDSDLENFHQKHVGKEFDEHLAKFGVTGFEIDKDYILECKIRARLAKDTAALHNSEKRRTERREQRLAKRVAEQSLTPEEVEVERINGLHRKRGACL